MSLQESLLGLELRPLPADEVEPLAAYFADHHYAVVRQAIPLDALALFRRYITLEVASGSYVYGDARATRWQRYRDPVGESLLVKTTEQLGQVVGCDLIPTYSFTVLYPPGADLPSHTDRPACEFSVSLTIANRHGAVDADPWPLYLADPDGGAPVALVLGPGDFVVYRGGDLAHFREPQPEGRHNYSLLLHYVNADGPFREYAWDAKPVPAG